MNYLPDTCSPAMDKSAFQVDFSFEAVVSNLISFIFRLSFGLASDIGRLKKRCWGWLHAASATDVSLSSLLICLVVLYQIEKMQQFSGVPPHSQCFNKQSSNNGAPSMVSKSSSKLICSGGLAKTYPRLLPVTAMTNFALTSCWNILERYSQGIPSALAIVAVVAGSCVLCLTIYINACNAYAEDFFTFIYLTPKSAVFRTMAQKTLCLFLSAISVPDIEKYCSVKVLHKHNSLLNNIIRRWKKRCISVTGVPRHKSICHGFSEMRILSQRFEKIEVLDITHRLNRHRLSWPICKGGHLKCIRILTN